MALLDGLEAHWEFEETSGNAADSSGFSSTLTAVNSPASVAGKVGNARVSNFDNKYFTITDNAHLSFGNEELTINLWGYVQNKGFDSTEIWVSKGTISGSDFSGGEYAIYWLQSSDRIIGRVSDGSSVIQTVEASTFGAINAGEWMMISFVHDPAANQIKIRVNNGSWDTASFSTGINSGANNFRVGADDAGRIRTVGFDELSLWRRIVTDEEFTELYNAGAGVAFEDWDLPLSDAVPYAVAHWPLDETSGTRADSVGSNDLTDNNTVLSATGMFGNAADFEATSNEWLSHWVTRTGWFGPG